MAIAAPTRLVLASGSPRRRDLLDGLGLVFTVRAADLDESPLAGEEPIAYVTRLAQEKAAAVAALADSPPGVRVAVLAADTTVALGREILAKPVDATDARRMLHALSGAVHQVHTGVALHVCDGAQPVHSEVLVVTTEVEMVRLDDAAIDWYVSTGEPMDKAGAYAIQGRAASFVRAVHGSVTNVVGLPMAETVQLLERADLPLEQLRR